MIISPKVECIASMTTWVNLIASHFDMPKVSTCRVTEGAPFRTLAGLFSLDASMVDTDCVNEDGPDTSTRNDDVNISDGLSEGATHHRQRRGQWSHGYLPEGHAGC